jgi:phosphomannomutase
MRETRRGAVAFGGEGNGGVIYPRVALGRDSLIGSALVLEALSNDHRPLSERLAGLPGYHMAKARVPFPPGHGLDAVFRRLEATYRGARPNRMDGLKMELPDGSWFALRLSNTEPAVRIVAESRDRLWSQRTMRDLEALVALGV